MNLDLGGTIWLNVSKQLLSYHKWFFVPFEKMPKHVYEEFRRHKHTHPSIKLGTSENGHSHKISVQHSHAHPDWSGASSTTDHYHTITLSTEDCGIGYTHRHTQTTYTANSHSHDCVLSFAPADLGSPWYNHVHAITLVSISSAGGSHTHGLYNTSTTRCAYCVYVGLPTHYHATSTALSLGYAGASHTHTLPASNTGNAYSTDTPENHRHPFNVTLNAADGHSHTVSGIFPYATCGGGFEHGHSYTSPTSIVSHQHSLSGDTGYGGEPLLVVGVPRWIGDSLAGAAIIALMRHLPKALKWPFKGLR
jgi:hypothetical protein